LPRNNNAALSSGAGWHLVKSPELSPHRRYQKHPSWQQFLKLPTSFSPIVGAIQALSSEITSLENTIADFAQSFTTDVLNSQQDNTQKLCVGNGPTDQNPVCITKAQLASLLSQSASAGLANPSPASAGPDLANSTPTAAAASSTPDTPPVIHINGDNPAIVQVGASCTDLGATITGPLADLNLGISTFVNGTAMNPVQLDTSTAATDTIAYVATDQSGLTSTTTRTVIIQAAAVSNDASSTSATTTAQ
jgi:hypothetical protein